MRALGIAPTPDEFETLLKNMDDTNSGSITRQKYLG